MNPEAIRQTLENILLQNSLSDLIAALQLLCLDRVIHHAEQNNPNTAFAWQSMSEVIHFAFTKARAKNL